MYHMHTADLLGSQTYFYCYLKKDLDKLIFDQNHSKENNSLEYYWAQASTCWILCFRYSVERLQGGGMWISVLRL